MTTAAETQTLLDNAFKLAWRLALKQLDEQGIKIGARVRNKDDVLFRISAMEPTVNNFGEDRPTLAIYCAGVKWRADQTWGDHEHWTGPVGDLTLD